MVSTRQGKAGAFHSAPEEHQLFYPLNFHLSSLCVQLSCFFFPLSDQPMGGGFQMGFCHDLGV